MRASSPCRSLPPSAHHALVRAGKYQDAHPWMQRVVVSKDLCYVFQHSHQDWEASVQHQPSHYTQLHAGVCSPRRSLPPSAHHAPVRAGQHRGAHPRMQHVVVSKDLCHVLQYLHQDREASVRHQPSHNTIRKMTCFLAWLGVTWPNWVYWPHWESWPNMPRHANAAVLLTVSPSHFKSAISSGKVSLLCLFEFVFLVSFCTFTSTFLYFSLMSFKSKRTGLFKDKKDNKKVWKSTDIIPDVPPKFSASTLYYLEHISYIW